MIKKLFILIIRIYQLCISPYLGKNCRFLPTCSDYAMQSIESHGVFNGIYLSCKRILKCHPFNDGGIDEVPKK